MGEKMKKLGLIIAIMVMVFFVSCEGNFSSNLQNTNLAQKINMPFGKTKEPTKPATQNLKPVIIAAQIDSPEIEPNTDFNIEGQIKNIGGTTATSFNLELTGLPKVFNLGKLSIDDTDKNIEPIKNPNFELGTSFSFENLKFTNNKIENPLTFDFYIKSTFGYKTTVTTTLCAKLNKDIQGCNMNAPVEHYVSKGYLNIPPPTVQIISDTEKEMKLVITYNIRKAFNDIKFGKLSEDGYDDEVKIDSISITPTNGFTMSKCFFSGINTQKDTAGCALTNSVVALSYGTGTLTIYVTIDKTQMTSSIQNYNIQFTLSYDVIDYVPMHVKIVPSK